MKYKNIFMFLALGSVAGAYRTNGSILNINYDKLSDTFLKNIGSKSSKKEYNLLEKILNKRTKELKDLYMQSDYIVKPEYLEWQIFYSAFYNYRSRGGIKERGIDPKKEPPRSIDLGMYIPVREITRENIEINKTPLAAPVEIVVREIPTPEVTPPYFSEIDFKAPELPTIYAQYATPMKTNDIMEIGEPATSYGFSIAGNKMYENLNVDSLAGTTLDFNAAADTIDVTGETFGHLGNLAARTLPSYTHIGFSPGFAVHNITYGENVTHNKNFLIKGDWNMKVTNGIDYTALGFLSYRPTSITSDSGVVFSGNLNLIPDTQNSHPYIIGMSLNLGDPNSTAKAVLENSGTITIDDRTSSGIQTVAMQLNSGNATSFMPGELINSGNITIKSTGSSSSWGGTGILIAVAPYTNPVLIKSGNINLEGNFSKGVETGNFEFNSKEYVNSSILLDGADGRITLSGTNNIGLYLQKGLSSTGNSLLDNVKNMDIYINGFRGSGITRNTTDPTEQSKNMILNNTVIRRAEFGEKSSYSNLFMVTNGTAILESNLADSVTMNAGTHNALIFGNAGSLIKNYMPITIGSGAKSMLGIGSLGSVENYADIVNNSSLEGGVGGGVGILLGGTGLSPGSENEYGLNRGNIEMNGDKSVAISTSGINMTSENDYIKVNGRAAVAVGASSAYIFGLNINKGSHTSIQTDKIELNGEDGVGINTFDSYITLKPKTSGQAVDMSINGKNSFAFNVNFRPSTVQEKKALTLDGDVNVDLKNGAIGFYYDGTGRDQSLKLSDYLTGLVDTTNGKLTVNADATSFNIAVNNAEINLSELKNLSDSPSLRFMNPGKSKVNSSLLTVDINSNIDKNNTTGDKTYRDTEIGRSGVFINQGVTISGTEDNLAGISQSFGLLDFDIRNSTNAGTINLSGNNSAGIYTKRSEQMNTGTLNITGNNSVGMYAASAVAKNTGNINIGNNGVGIYAESYLLPADASDGYSYFNVYNSGKITASSGEKAVGIYVNENSPDGDTVNGKLFLESGSNIDVSASKGGIGIYSNKSGISSDSGSHKITVGENGTGIYIKDSNAALNNLELNLYGDNSTGIYTDGTSSFTGSGTVNVSGKSIVVFNVVGSGTFDQNFLVNAAPDSQYTFQNIKDKTLYYNSTTSMGTGGTFISGINSAVLLGENSNITGNGDNIVGLSLKGPYSGGLPVTMNGESVSHEATNKGRITLAGKSTGIYVTNGAKGKNEGILSLGDDSVGIYGTTSGTSIENSGEITFGAKSTALYLKDGNTASNSGTIYSSGAQSAGFYLDGNNDIQAENTGTLQLTGDKSVGVYITSGGVKHFNNKNTITIGNSENISDPSVGIFNDNSSAVINNSANIISGNNSTGIYSNGGNVTHTAGNFEIGTSGTGIYMNSGNLNLTGGKLMLTGENTVGINAENGAVVDNNAETNVSSGSYGIVLNKDASYTGRNISNLKNSGILLYSDGNTSVNNETGANIHMSGSDSVGFYMVNGGNIVNKADITGNTGTGNIGIYNKDGSISNSGNIKIGDSIIIDPKNVYANKYAVALYGENVTNMSNSGNIEVGSNGVGFYSINNINESVNTGSISSVSDKAIGIYIESGAVRNAGNITLSGNGSIGIAGTRNTNITNAGTITLNGKNSIGIYANVNSKVINESTGKIYINANDSIGIQLTGGSTLENNGLIEIASGVIGSKEIVNDDDAFTPPSIINAGVIKVDRKFELNGFDLIIKPDPSSFRVPTIEEISAGGYAPADINAGFLLSNKVNITAPSFDFGGNSAKIDPLFTQGTNARVYKFENVFDPTADKQSDNKISVESNSLTFTATPIANKQGKIDIWIEKINYDNFTKGLWYDGFAQNIEGKYLNAKGDALKIYDKLDLIKDTDILRNSLDQLAGSMYSNMYQREEDIYSVLNNALFTLQNSENNTKENVKINVIVGKGTTKEDTSGVNSYNYDTVGVLALREVERTYRHKFGYSLGYTRTDFQMRDTKNEDQANTVQLGIHNKYSVNGWNFKNDLLGRVSLHTSDRTMSWYDKTNSNLKADYNVYGVTSLNEIGKDFELGKNVKVTPYTGVELGYMTRESFEEKGGPERLKVEGNDAYSVKPSVGVRIEAEKNLGNTDWKIKSNVGAAYEYELGDMNKQEKASLEVIEDGYHKLAKPADDKGKIKTSVMAGVELKDRYGVFVTGEYGIGNSNKEDYKVGLSFKASF